jgi:type IV secretory pathway TraG/TraD family ATPase VirD4
MSTPTSSSSNNTSLRNVRLMRPEQLRTLPNDGLIIFFRGFAPIVCGKAICFRREEWQQYTPYIKE